MLRKTIAFLGVIFLCSGNGSLPQPIFFLAPQSGLASDPITSFSQLKTVLLTVDQLPKIKSDQYQRLELFREIFRAPSSQEYVERTLELYQQHLKDNLELPSFPYGKKIMLNGFEYELLAPGIILELTYFKAFQFKGVYARDQKGNIVLLKLKEKKVEYYNPNPEFFTIRSYQGSNIEGGSTELKLTLASKATFKDKDVEVIQYGGEYLNPKYLDGPPASSFDFDRVHFSHRTSLENVIDLFQKGLLPNTVTGRAVGDNLHDSQVSLWARKGFFEERSPVVYISQQSARANRVYTRVPRGKLSDDLAKEALATRLVSIGNVINPEHIVVNEVQTNRISPEAFVAIALSIEEYEEIFPLMEKGFIPLVPVYNRETGALMNQNYLEQRSKDFVYKVEEPSVTVNQNQLTVDLTLYSGDWESEDIVAHHGLDVPVRYGLLDDEGMTWSDADSDLMPKSIQVLGRTPHSGYRIRIVYTLPETNSREIDFALQLKTNRGQLFWVKDGKRNFLVPLPESVSLFNRSAAVESSL